MAPQAVGTILGLTSAIGEVSIPFIEDWQRSLVAVREEFGD